MNSNYIEKWGGGSQNALKERFQSETTLLITSQWTLLLSSSEETSFIGLFWMAQLQYCGAMVITPKDIGKEAMRKEIVMSYASGTLY